MRTLTRTIIMAVVLSTAGCTMTNPKTTGPRSVSRTAMTKVTGTASTATPSTSKPAPGPGQQEEELPYWFNPKIHNLGNVGVMGAIHALVAPLATHLIDRLAYGGADARKLVHATMRPEYSVVDLACGVGFSSYKGALGVDTSAQMVAFARMRRPDCTFVKGNAETFGEDASTDMVTVMFGFHEMPREARRKVLRNAARIARKEVIIVDIDPDFTPSDVMLSGEPYVLEYLRNVDEDISEVARNRAWKSARVNVVPGHVIMWRLYL
mmetsp:Transcript_2962/g.8617  ORF Transcript_2962/g.8617 Transcript_2962/m.8617 type:complete len:266 (-) Transcript_2962:447-1244(-)